MPRPLGTHRPRKGPCRSTPWCNWCRSVRFRMRIPALNRKCPERTDSRFRMGCSYRPHTHHSSIDRRVCKHPHRRKACRWQYLDTDHLRDRRPGCPSLLHRSQRQEQEHRSCCRFQSFRRRSDKPRMSRQETLTPICARIPPEPTVLDPNIGQGIVEKHELGRRFLQVANAKRLIASGSPSPPQRWRPSHQALALT